MLDRPANSILGVTRLADSVLHIDRRWPFATTSHPASRVALRCVIERRRIRVSSLSLAVLTNFCGKPHTYFGLLTQLFNSSNVFCMYRHF